MQNTDDIGTKIYELIDKLYPICRSITGNGVRNTMQIIDNIIPLTITEIPSNTDVFDWTIPREWNITDAWIKNSTGEKIIDFQKSNLHVVSYSVPIHKKISLSELKKHLYYIPDHPNWIPYKTSYYKEDWGFCISYKQFESLLDDEYEVLIDSTLENGSLTYGEFFIKGERDDEILITCYVCHPSMCNDNLSGVALVTYLAQEILKFNTKYSYRFLFIPETIGAITWLHQNQKLLPNIKLGIVVTCVGDDGVSTYKKTKSGDTILDIVVTKILEESQTPFKILNFFPYGSDERQFSSPGIDIPTGSLMKSVYNQFSEYHTSADNLQFMSKNSLVDSFNKYFKIFQELEKQDFLERTNLKKRPDYSLGDYYLSSNLNCEPNLGKRGLYRTLHNKSVKIDDLAIFWILNYSDGFHSLLEISKISEIDYFIIKENTKLLEQKNLVHLCT